jgi:hypothetical protein
MKVQIGKIVLSEVTKQNVTYPYKNKSKKYLFPAINLYGKEFTDKANAVFKVAIGVGDIIYRKAKERKHEKHLFILCDTAVLTQHFITFITWIREQPQYEDDYPYGNLQKSTFHMVIIKFPESLDNSFELFKAGNYSQMYNSDQIKEFFTKHPNVLRVLIKDHNYKLQFTHKLNRIYGSSLSVSDWEGELDLPPKPVEEIFNHPLKG